MSAFSCGPKAPPPAVAAQAKPLDEAALDRMVARAAKEKTHALVILRDGQLAYENYFGAAKEDARVTMSVSKTVTALAILHLWDSGKLASLDESMATIFKEWASDPPGPRDRRNITMRHMLVHTSGLPTERAKTWEGAKFSDHLRTLSLEEAPGSVFVYNNDAVDLLSVAVHRISGFYLDDYLHRFLFGTLGISGAYWMKDPEGHPRAAGEFFVNPRDLAKIGQLIVDRGVWKGTRLLSERAIDALVTPSAKSPSCGLLTWLRGGVKKRVLAIPAEVAAKAKLEEKTRTALEKAKGQEIVDWQDLVQSGAVTHVELRALLEAADALRIKLSEEIVVGPPVAYTGEGYLGQWLVVLPQSRVVAVRMHSPEMSEYTTNDGSTSYAGFWKEVVDLVR